MNKTVRLTLWAITSLGLPLSTSILFSLYGPVHGWFDYQNYLIGRDFVNFWFGPHLAVTGRLADIYDLQRYLAALQAQIAPQSPFMNFSYPPTLLVLLLPLGFISWGAAYVAWFAFGVMAYVFIALGGLKTSRDRELAVMLILSPAFQAAAIIGQLSMLLCLLLIGGLRLLPTRPVLAGILFGLATVKPQFGLLIAAVLLTQRQWLTIGVALATASALLLLSFVLFGAEPWHAYINNTLPYQREVLSSPEMGAWTGMVSIYGFLVKIGVGLPVAFAMHIAAALAVAGLALYSTWVSKSWALNVAILGFATVLVTPYVLHYDLAIPAAGLIFYLKSRIDNLKPWLLVAIGVFWALPIPLILLDTMGISVIAPVLMIVFAGLVWEAISTKHQSESPEPQDLGKSPGDLSGPGADFSFSPPYAALTNPH